MIEPDENTEREVVEYVYAIGHRYGFKPTDLRVELKNRTRADELEVVIQTIDGSATQKINADEQTLDRWRLVPRIEHAIREMSQRSR